MVGGLMMGTTDENIAGYKDWVKDNIESRVERGKEWRSQLKAHKDLAKASRYIRILGRDFRPVSISDVNPCGHLRDKDDEEIGNCPSLTDAIAKARSATERKPGADKPEHRVQAFLIRAAMQNDLRFGQVLPIFSDVFDELIFVTDELAVKPGNEKKEYRTDIVALGGKREQFFPVFIELKNERLLGELKKQLDSAYNMLWKNDRAREPLRRFLSAVSGVELAKIDQEARKMIIWPKSLSGIESELVEQARNEGFLIVDFELTYIFSRKTA
jgi:hypothetical protein